MKLGDEEKMRQYSKGYYAKNRDMVLEKRRFRYKMRSLPKDTYTLPDHHVRTKERIILELLSQADDFPEVNDIVYRLRSDKP